jgi:hypothetical protein
MSRFIARGRFVRHQWLRASSVDQSVTFANSKSYLNNKINALQLFLNLIKSSFDIQRAAICAIYIAKMEVPGGHSRYVRRIV